MKSKEILEVTEAWVTVISLMRCSTTTRILLRTYWSGKVRCRSCQASKLQIDLYLSLDKTCRVGLLPASQAQADSWAAYLSNELAEAAWARTLSYSSANLRACSQLLRLLRQLGCVQPCRPGAPRLISQ